MTVAAVADDQWPIVAWLWQDFRHDIAPVVPGKPDVAPDHWIRTG